MPTTAVTGVARMRDQLFFEGPDVGRKLSRFWLLLLLAGVIATAGVVADSTATVIGAMIVAPLMTPILGSVVAVVLADRDNLIRSAGLVVGGAAVGRRDRVARRARGRHAGRRGDERAGRVARRRPG